MIEDGWRFLGVVIEGSDPRLLTALFVALGYMMAAQLVLYALDWLWRKVRPPKTPSIPPIKRYYELRSKEGDEYWIEVLKQIARKKE